MNKSIIATIVLFLCILHVAFPQERQERDKIYGGQYADEGQFPFLIQLYHKTQEYHFCGGSLIGSYHVLTAAHCVEDTLASRIQIFAGSVDLYANDAVYIDVASITVHPNYNSRLIENDVAVIEMKAPFPKSTGVRAIDMASGSIATGTVMNIAGWGKTEYYYYPYPQYLLWTTAPVISTTKCRSYNGYEDVSGAQQICLYRNGHDTCQGDSGGPMFRNQGANAIQYGIVSWGIGCGSKPGVYARVSYYRDWIVAQTEKIVSTPCNGCTTDSKWKAMCQSMGGVYKKTSSQYQCRELNVDKMQTISYSWSGCTNTKLQDFCEKVGIYTCSSGQSKCTAL